jgi:transposase
MDMNAGYLEEFHAQCLQAEIVYDLSRVGARYGREVIDRVQVDEANRMRHDPKARTVVIEERVRVREARKASRKEAKRRAGLPGEGPPGEKGV